MIGILLLIDLFKLIINERIIKEKMKKEKS